ncbi:MAG: hypothetical protein KDE51_02455, partial [Anaerolineales bacterium]|nr:hypothetical protein [Anaerolineales bacterium]
MEAHISSGEMHTVQNEKRTSFNVLGKLVGGLEQALKRDLQKVLGNTQISLKNEEGRLRLNLFGKKAPVELLDILETVTTVPPLTAVLGWTAEQRPVFFDFKAEETSHVLISGKGRAGKSALLRTIALSLALNNRERDLQLIIIDGRYSQVPQPYEHSGLRPFNYLPHLLTPVITNYDTAVETLQFLVDETQHRGENQIKTPSIILLIDHLVDLVEVCGAAALIPLTHLIRNGAKHGIHLVLSTQKVEVAILQDIHDAYVPARIVGQVESAAQAEIAADAYDTQAEHLQGDGDFIAVVGQVLTHFQAAYVGDYDLHMCLEQLHHHRPPSLVAHTFDIRPRLQVAEATTTYQAENSGDEADQTEAFLDEATDDAPSSTTIVYPPQQRPTTASFNEQDEAADEEDEDDTESYVVWSTPQTTAKYATVETNDGASEDLFDEYEDETELDDEEDHTSWFTAPPPAKEVKPTQTDMPPKPPTRPVLSKQTEPTQPDHQPIPSKPAAQTTNHPPEGEDWFDEIPFSWESPRFDPDALADDEAAVTASAWVEPQEDEVMLDEVQDEIVEQAPEALAADTAAAPPAAPRKPPTAQKNRFSGVRDLLSKIDESLPDKPPTNTQSSPSAPTSSATTPSPVTKSAVVEDKKPNGHDTQSTLRFNSLVPKVQRPKVAQYLNKPARPVPIEKQLEHKPTQEKSSPEETEEEIEFVEFDDGWSQAEQEAATAGEPFEEAEPSAPKSEEAREETGTITTENKDGSKTIRILNGDKPAPPTYPSYKRQRYRRTTQKLQ